MSVKRADLVRYLEVGGFSLLREGANHSIYPDGEKVVPVKRARRPALIEDGSNPVSAPVFPRTRARPVYHPAP